jgi:iron complex outermembrane recepter protein
MRIVAHSTLLVATSSLALLAAQARAQDSTATKGEPEIVVTGTRASLQSAESVKRRAAVVVDGITADDIGALPDVSISESLIRITGVSSNDTVRGSDQVAIRGLGPDLVSTEYNGRVLPTADGATRRVGLAGLPTEGLSGAFAQKTPDAATIEGGVAGILQLQTIHPLETKRRGLTLVARGMYTDTADKLKRSKDLSPLGYRGEVTYVGQLADNFGIAVSYAGIKQYSAENGVQLDGWRAGTTTRADLNGDGAVDALPTTAGPFAGYFSTERHSIVSMAQWDPSSAVRVSLDGLFDRDHYKQGTRRYFGFNLFNGALGAATGSTVTNDVATSFDGRAGGYRGVLALSDVKDHTYQGGLNVAIDDGGPFKAKLDFSYADAGRKRFSPTVNFENDAATVAAQQMPFSYDIRDRSNVGFTFSPLTPEDYAIQQASTVGQRSSDKIKAFRADFTYDAGRLVKSVQWGVKIDHRRHTQAVDNTLYTYANLAARPDLDSSYLETTTNPFTGATGAFGGPTAVAFPYYDLDKLLTLATSSPGVIVNDQFASDVGAGAIVTEMNYALYGQANIEAGPLTGNVGLRWILTDQNVSGQAGTSPANAIDQRFSNSYNYLLPSLNLRYELTPKLVARLGASKTVSRPVFEDLAVGSAVDLTTAPSTGVVNITRGNPTLKPFTSNGIDAGFEWYPSRAMTVSVAGYYKWVKNFVVTETTTSTITFPDGSVFPAIITQSINSPGTSHFKGWEAQFRRDFDFLPGIWSSLGVQANWNHNLTDARETFTSLVGNTVPVYPINLSRDVVNAQLYFSRKNIDFRVAYRYYSSYSRQFASGYQYQPEGQVDMTLGLNIIDHVRFTGTVTNLLAAKIYRTTADYRDLSSQTMLQHYAYQGRAVTIGLRMQF